MYHGQKLGKPMVLLAPSGSNGSEVAFCGLLKIVLSIGMYHGKYRGWNGSTVEISCWADLARPSTHCFVQDINVALEISTSI